MFSRTPMHCPDLDTQTVSQSFINAT